MEGDFIITAPNIASSEQMRSFNEKWEKPCHWENYDTISMTDTDMDALFPKLNDIGMSDWLQLLEKPALLNFVLSTKGTIGITKILFKKSVLPCEKNFHNVRENLREKTIPCIDAYVSFNGKSQHDVVLSFGITMFDDGTKIFPSIAHAVMWVWRKEERANFYVHHPHAQASWDRVKFSFLAVQKAIQDRPTIFTERKITRPIENIGSSKKRKKNKKRKVRVIRIMRLNSDELTEYVKTHRKIECPCWGVMGHWRSYKSGKKVWIAPYRKGRERSNPDVYSPKEYQLEEESVCK